MGAKKGSKKQNQKNKKSSNKSNEDDFIKNVKETIEINQVNFDKPVKSNLLDSIAYLKCHDIKTIGHILSKFSAIESILTRSFSRTEILKLKNSDDLDTIGLTDVHNTFAGFKPKTKLQYRPPDQESFIDWPKSKENIELMSIRWKDQNSSNREYEQLDIIPDFFKVFHLLCQYVAEFLYEVSQDLPECKNEEKVPFEQLNDPNYEINDDITMEDELYKFNWSQYQNKCDLFIELFVDTVIKITNSNEILEQKDLKKLNYTWLFEVEHSDVHNILIGLITLINPSTDSASVQYIIECKHRFIYYRLNITKNIIQTIYEIGDKWWLNMVIQLLEILCIGSNRASGFMMKDCAHPLYAANCANVLMMVPPNKSLPDIIKTFSYSYLAPNEMCKCIKPSMYREIYSDPSLTMMTNIEWNNELTRMPPMFFWKLKEVIHKDTKLDFQNVNLLTENIDPDNSFTCVSSIADPRIFVDINDVFTHYCAIDNPDIKTYLKYYCDNPNGKYHSHVKITDPIILAVKLFQLPSQRTDKNGKKIDPIIIGQWNHLPCHKQHVLSYQDTLVITDASDTSMMVEIPNAIPESSRYIEISTQLSI